MHGVCLFGAAFNACSVIKQPACQGEGCRPSPWPKETSWHSYIKGCPCIDRQANLRRNASCLENRAVKPTTCSPFLQLSPLLLVFSAAFKKQSWWEHIDFSLWFILFSEKSHGMPSPSLDLRPDQLLWQHCAVARWGGCSPLGEHFQAVALGTRRLRLLP